MRIPRIAPHILRFRWVLLVLMATLTALSAWGLLGGQGAWRSVGEEELSSEESIFEEMLAEFGVDQNSCLVVVEGPDLLGPEPVAITRKLVQRLEDLDLVEDVLWVDDIPSFGGGLAPLPLLPPNGSGAAAFRRGSQAALTHPLVGGHLLARDGSLWILPVAFDEEVLEAWALAPTDPAPLDQLQEVLDSAPLASSMRATLTGSWPITAAGEERFETEQWLFHGLAYALTFVLAALLFRSVWAVILTGGGPMLGVLWTFGLLRLLGVELNGLTRVILPVMIMMVGFTDSVHLMIHVRRERAAGKSPFLAADSAVRELLLPCWLTSFTTAIGFGSLLLAKTELIQVFGFASMIGALFTFLAVVSFLPFFASTPIGRFLVERESSSLVDGTLPAARGLARLILSRAKVVALVGSAVTLGCLLLGLRVETDNRVLADIPESSPSAEVLGRIDEALGGTVPVSVFVNWDAAHDGDGAAILAAISAAHDRLAREPEFSEPLALPDLLSALPGAASSTLVDRLATLHLAPPQVRERLYLEEERVARVEALLPDLGYEHFAPSFEALEADLEALEREHPGFEFHLTGQAVVSGLRFAEVSRDLIQSLALASLTIFAVLAMAFHSLRLGLISIVPNAFPLAVTAALLVLLDLPMAGATAFVMSLGIAVDDTVHLVARFRRELDGGADLDAAIEAALLGVGKALIITTLILVLGFAPVLTSDFPRNRAFSGMIIVTVASALIGDLLILPAMLKVFGQRRPFRVRRSQ